MQILKIIFYFLLKYSWVTYPCTFHCYIDFKINYTNAFNLPNKQDWSLFVLPTNTHTNRRKGRILQTMDNKMKFVGMTYISFAKFSLNIRHVVFLLSKTKIPSLQNIVNRIFGQTNYK